MVLLVIGSITLEVTIAQADSSAFEALTQSGFDHFYSLEYEQSIHDFQKALEANPDEPKAVNHLLEATLFQELYRYNALDTRLYAKERFLTSKQVSMDPAAKKRIRDLAERAQALSEKRLKSNPKDVQALYSRGVTEGLTGTYLAVVEHAWWSALRKALAARHDHEEVLRLQPDFADAKTIPGGHNYVVGSLSLPAKALVGVIGVHGDKALGLRLLAEAGKGGGESSADARVALALFLRREERYQEALDVVRSLTHDHPRNFLFALEEGNLLRDAGKASEAAASFRSLLSACNEVRYPNAHVEMAQFDLGEALRSQGKHQEAFQAYQAAGSASGNDAELRQRALLAAGEVSDMLSKRDEALTQYRAAIAVNASTEEAVAARKYLDKPYHGH
jgi:tetratricopeptide (TPR) repeat protein